MHLGCKHEKQKILVDGESLVALTYNMEGYFSTIVRDYEALSSDLLGKEVTLKAVATPLLEDDHKSSPARAQVSCDPSIPVCLWCKVPCVTTAVDIVEMDVKKNQEKQKAQSAATLASALQGAADNGKTG